jgi:hypothetical protein
MDDDELRAARYLQRVAGVTITNLPDLIDFVKRHCYLVDPGANVRITNDVNILNTLRIEPHHCTIGGVSEDSVLHGAARAPLQAETFMLDESDPSASPKSYKMPEIPFIVVKPDAPLSFKILSYRDTKNINNFFISIDNSYLQIDGRLQHLLQINGQLFVYLFPWRHNVTAVPAVSRPDKDFMIQATAFMAASGPRDGNDSAQD